MKVPRRSTGDSLGGLTPGTLGSSEVRGNRVGGWEQGWMGTLNTQHCSTYHDGR